MTRNDQPSDQPSDPQPEVPHSVPRAPGAGGAPLALDVLIRALRHDPSIEVRASAAQELRLHGALEALPAIIDALHDDMEVAHSAADALIALGDSSVAPMLAALADPSWSVRAFAATVVGRLRAAAAAEKLIEALRDDHWNVRQNSAQALGELEEMRATSPLVACLHDECWEVRSAAAGALQQIGGPEALAALRAALAGDDYVVWAEAAWALATHQGPSVVDTLIAVFARVPNPAIGHGLASAVASLHESAVQPLLEALEHHDSNVRYWAIKALAALGSVEVLPHLRWMEEHDMGETPTRAQVRAAARRAIRAITKRQTRDDTSS